MPVVSERLPAPTPHYDRENEAVFRRAVENTLRRLSEVATVSEVSDTLTLTLPLTARGDLLSRDATHNVRLAVGAAGRYLRSSGLDPSWTAITAPDIGAGVFQLGNFTFRGHVLFSTDNTYDIGASGATRPRTGYFGTALDVADTAGATSWVRSGQFIVGDSTVSATSTNLSIRSEAGKNRHIAWQTGSASRWLLRANSDAESGSDAGSDFDLYRMSDAAVATLVAQVRRSDGATFWNSVVFGINRSSHVGTDRSAEINGTPTGSATTQFGTVIDQRVNVSATSLGIGTYFRCTTVADTYTLAQLSKVRISESTRGAGSTITTQIGLDIETLSQGTNNHAIQTGTGNACRWGGPNLWLTDNTYDIGAAGATRPRTGYFGTSIVAGTDPGGSNPIRSGGGVTQNSVSALIRAQTAMNNGAAAGSGTLLNAPAAGNPTKWIPIDDAGTTRYIPAW